MLVAGMIAMITFCMCISAPAGVCARDALLIGLQVSSRDLVGFSIVTPVPPHSP